VRGGAEEILDLRSKQKKKRGRPCKFEQEKGFFWSTAPSTWASPFENLEMEVLEEVQQSWFQTGGVYRSKGW
jgi:hypothetical protein